MSVSVSKVFVMGSGIIAALALFTLLAGMAVAIYQVWEADKAKRKGEHFDGSQERPKA